MKPTRPAVPAPEPRSVRGPGPTGPAAPPGPDREMIVDTSSMNEGQRAALEIAESARDLGDGKGAFAAAIFAGRLDPRALAAFPAQSEADRATGDALVASVSAFLRDHLDADLVDETRTIPAEVIVGLRDLGVFRMKVPVEYGGLGVSQVNYNRVIQAIASWCGSTAVLVSAHQSIGVPQPLRMFGTEAQKAAYLPRIAAGALSGFALTESDVGSDPARMTTTARLSDDGSHYVLNGEKLWTTNGPIAELLVVMAQTAPQVRRGRVKARITAFVVETSWPGVEVAHRCDFMGLRAIQNGVIRFRDVKVPAENVLVGEGHGLRLALRTLNTGRLTLPAACAAMGKQCVSIARAWGRERVQWGHPIGRHEAGAAKIADIAAFTFAMEAVTWLTSHWADEGRDIRIEAAMAKLFASEAAWKVIDDTMQLRGGRGYERATSLRARGEAPYPVERMMRDTRINRIIEGTSDIMRLFLAREALDPHLSRASELIRPGARPGARLRAAIRLAGFYATWYPARVAGGRLAGPIVARTALDRHDRFARRASNRVAAALFRAMAMNGPKLERRQVLLAHLMDAATEIFAMTVTCAYARSIARPGAAALADHFCRGARLRVLAHLRAAPRRGPAASIARDVMDGGLTWLEEGVIPVEVAGR